MTLFIIKNKDLKERLDPSFYNPLYTDILNKQQWNKCKDIAISIQHPPEYKRNYSNKGLQLIRSQNVRPTGLNLKESPVYFSNDFLKNKKIIFPQKGDVLIVRSGVNAGDVCFIEKDIKTAIIGADNLLLKPNQNIIPKFIQVWFFTKFGRMLLNRYLTGATNKHISPYYLAKVPIPKITKDKQSICIDLLEKGLKLKNKKNIEVEKLLNSINVYLLKELGITLPKKDNSLENRIFTTKYSNISTRLDPFYYQNYFKKINNCLIEGKYKTTKLKDLIIFIESGNRPQGGVSSIKEGIFSIGGEHINSKGEVGNGNPKFIPNYFHKTHLKTETRLNDIFLVKDGATTGKVGILENKNYVNQNINEHVFLIRVNLNKTHPLFFTYYLHTNLCQNLILKEITGATVTGLTKPSIKTLKISLPPLNIQKEIASQIKKIRMKAKQLEKEGLNILENINKEIENIIYQD